MSTLRGFQFETGNQNILARYVLSLTRNILEDEITDQYTDKDKKIIQSFFQKRFQQRHCRNIQIFNLLFSNFVKENPTQNMFTDSTFFYAKKWLSIDNVNMYCQYLQQDSYLIDVLDTTLSKTDLATQIVAIIETALYTTRTNTILVLQQIQQDRDDYFPCLHEFAIVRAKENDITFYGIKDDEFMTVIGNKIEEHNNKYTFNKITNMGFKSAREFPFDEVKKKTFITNSYSIRANNTTDIPQLRFPFADVKYLVPCNYNQNHWICYNIDIDGSRDSPKYSVSLFNSFQSAKDNFDKFLNNKGRTMNNSEKNLKRQLDPIRNLLENNTSTSYNVYNFTLQERFTLVQSKFNNNTAFIQQNGYDCGLYVLYYIDAVVFLEKCRTLYNISDSMLDALNNLFFKTLERTDFDSNHYRFFIHNRILTWKHLDLDNYDRIPGIPGMTTNVLKDLDSFLYGIKKPMPRKFPFNADEFPEKNTCSDIFMPINDCLEYENVKVCVSDIQTRIITPAPMDMEQYIDTFIFSGGKNSTLVQKFIANMNNATSCIDVHAILIYDIKDVDSYKIIWEKFYKYDMFMLFIEFDTPIEDKVGNIVSMKSYIPFYLYTRNNILYYFHTKDDPVIITKIQRIKKQVENVLLEHKIPLIHVEYILPLSSSSSSSLSDAAYKNRIQSVGVDFIPCIKDKNLTRLYGHGNLLGMAIDINRNYPTEDPIFDFDEPNVSKYVYSSQVFQILLADLLAHNCPLDRLFKESSKERIEEYILKYATYLDNLTIPLRQEPEIPSDASDVEYDVPKTVPEEVGAKRQLTTTRPKDPKSKKTRTEITLNTDMIDKYLANNKSLAGKKIVCINTSPSLDYDIIQQLKQKYGSSIHVFDYNENKSTYPGKVDVNIEPITTRIALVIDFQNDQEKNLDFFEYTFNDPISYKKYDWCIYFHIIQPFYNNTKKFRINQDARVFGINKEKNEIVSKNCVTMNRYFFEKEYAYVSDIDMSCIETRDIQKLLSIVKKRIKNNIYNGVLITDSRLKVDELSEQFNIFIPLYEKIVRHLKSSSSWNKDVDSFDFSLLIDYFNRWDRE